MDESWKGDWTGSTRLEFWTRNTSDVPITMYLYLDTDEDNDEVYFQSLVVLPPSSQQNIWKKQVIYLSDFLVNADTSQATPVIPDWSHVISMNFLIMKKAVEQQILIDEITLYDERWFFEQIIDPDALGPLSTDYRQALAEGRYGYGSHGLLPLTPTPGADDIVEAEIGPEKNIKTAFGNAWFGQRKTIKRNMKNKSTAFFWSVAAADGNLARGVWSQEQIVYLVK